MNNLEFIEQYVTGQLSAAERTQFENALQTDPALADLLAFYVLSKHTAKAEAREQRRAELDALRHQLAQPPTASEGADSRVRSLWSAPMRWAAAASVVLLLGLGWYFLRDTVSTANPRQLADAYISRNYDQLTTTMSGGTTDSLTQGIGLYNEKKFSEAEAVFEQLLTQQPNNDRVLKFAGIVALRQQKYDQAIARFNRLSQRTDLFSNPGTFLEALARLQRNRPMDKEQAKKLLNEVVVKNLEGKAEAEQLLSTY
ncbi:tetratricopeptide repeat protein [Spirosoma montaniterrae]|uniref:Uncharacterized protein n=1 Tax=Spirosoma montaniterrae TaxID=1178516 RepID=A0A1P9WUX8_9BACT|nr:tetratricopeptide repeat protein [Spirosoma montaniterrae]AQG79153.1 hypothetical protein AWR27_07350 [Spirosoma montaniterrae]